MNQQKRVATGMPPATAVVEMVNERAVVVQSCGAWSRRGWSEEKQILPLPPPNLPQRANALWGP